MLRRFGTTLASVALAGATIMSIASTGYADDAGMNAFRNADSGGATPAVRSESSRNNEGYRATYNETARPTPGASVAKPEKDPPYFYHAAGTMGVP